MTPERSDEDVAREICIHHDSDDGGYLQSPGFSDAVAEAIARGRELGWNAAIEAAASMECPDGAGIDCEDCGRWAARIRALLKPMKP